MCWTSFSPCKSRFRNKLVGFRLGGVVRFGDIADVLASDLSDHIESYGPDEISLHECQIDDEDAVDLVIFDDEIIGAIDREMSDSDISECRAHLLATRIIHIRCTA